MEQIDLAKLKMQMAKAMPEEFLLMRLQKDLNQYTEDNSEKNKHTLVFTMELLTERYMTEGKTQEECVEMMENAHKAFHFFNPDKQ